MKMDLQKGLVGHWTLDDADTSGGTVYDSSAYENDGTLNGSINTNAAGKVGNAYEFDDTNGDYILTPLGDQAPEMTITAWINMDTYGTSIRYHTHIVRAGQTWFLIDSSSESLWSGVKTDSGQTEFTSNSQIDTGIWEFVAMTVETDTITHYVNDNIYTKTLSATRSTDSADFAIGTDGGNPDAGFDGLMDDVRIYDRALSESEISILYNMRSQRNAEVN